MHLGAYRKNYYQTNLHTFDLHSHFIDPLNYLLPLSHDANNWLSYDARLNTEKKLIEKIVKERIIMSEAQNKGRIKTYSETGYDKKIQSSLHQKRNQKWPFTPQTKTKSISDSIQDPGNKPDRSRSAGAGFSRKNLEANNERHSWVVLGASMVNREQVRLSVKQNQQQPKTQLNCWNKKIQHFSQEPNNIELQIALLKQQVQQKNRTIVDLECKLLKLQSIYEQMTKKSIVSKKQRLCIQTWGSICATPSPKTLSVCNLISISSQHPVEAGEQKSSLNQSIESFQVNQQANMNERTVLEKMPPLKVEKINSFPQKLSESINIATNSSQAFQVQNRETLAESVIFSPDFNNSSVDLTLSVSQLVPSPRDKLIKKQSNIPNNSGAIGDESIILEIEDELVDESSQIEEQRCEEYSGKTVKKIGWPHRN